MNGSASALVLAISTHSNASLLPRTSNPSKERASFLALGVYVNRWFSRKDRSCLLSRAARVKGWRQIARGPCFSVQEMSCSLNSPASRLEAQHSKSGLALHSTAQHGTAQHGRAQHGRAQHGGAQHGRAQHRSTSCSTVCKCSRSQQAARAAAPILG